MCTPRSCGRFWAKRIYYCWTGCVTPKCGFAGCCKCPHGCCYTFMALLSGFGGLYVNWYVIRSCLIQRITEINKVTGEPIESTKRGYGFLSREIMEGEEATYDQCIAYPAEEADYLFDFWITMAKYMAYISAILGFIALCVLVFAPCISFSPPTFERWLTWVYLWAAICIALTMLIYGNGFCSENECRVAEGTGQVIACFFAWLGSANTVKSMGQPPPRDMPDEGDEEDDLWYDDEDNRWPEPPEEEQQKLAQAEPQEKKPAPEDLARRRRGRKPYDDEGRFIQDTDRPFDDVEEYMAPEDGYLAKQDEDFLPSRNVRQQQQQPTESDDPEDNRVDGNLGVGYQDDPDAPKRVGEPGGPTIT